MKFIIILLALALISATASAISPELIYSTQTFLPNTTAEFMTANVSNTNFTATEMSMVYNFPFTVNMTHYTYANHTEFVFTSDLPAHISENTYFGTLYLSYLNDTMIVPFNISVGEHTLWQIDSSTVYMDANVSQEYVMPVAVENLGNIETTLSINMTGSCTDYTTATQGKVTYPELDNELLLTFSIPDNHTTATDICEILVYNADNHSDSMAFNVSLNISDNIMPVIEAVHIYDSMALKDNEMIITATDNVILKNVTGTIIYDNLTYWYDNGTRFESLENVTIADFSFTQSGDEWIYIFEDTDRIDKYYVNYTVTDSSNNTVIGYKTFDIEELDCLYYDQMVDGLLLQRDNEAKESLLSSDFDIPLNITLVGVTDVKSGASVDNVTNDTYRVGIIDFSGNSVYFSGIGDSVTLDGTGSVDLLFTANYLAQFVVKLNISAPEQHTAVEDITYTVQTIAYAPPFDHYEYSPIAGVRWVCDAHNGDRIEDSYHDCNVKLGWEYMISSDNMPFFKTLREIQTEKELWDGRLSDKEDRIQSVEQWLSLVSIIAGLLLFALLFNKFSRHFMFMVK